MVQPPINLDDPFPAIYLGALALLVHGYASSGKTHSPEWLDRNAAELANLAVDRLRGNSKEKKRDRP